MDRQRVDMFLMTNAKYFDNYQLSAIRESLLSMDESKWLTVSTLSFKDPTTMLIVSLLGGSLGIDRFMIGDVGLGIGKLLTCGGFSVWTIVDWFLIMDATRKKNTELLQNALIY